MSKYVIGITGICDPDLDIRWGDTHFDPIIYETFKTWRDFAGQVFRVEGEAEDARNLMCIDGPAKGLTFLMRGDRCRDLSPLEALAMLS